MQSWVMVLAYFGVNTMYGQTATRPINKPTVAFHVEYQGKELRLDSTYFLNEKDSINFETFKLYISGMEYLLNGKVKATDNKACHLLDLSKISSCTWDMPEMQHYIKPDSVRIRIGIDSVTNLAGSLGGQLDPTNGMYWTWQSGYINMKLEGKSNLCYNKNQEFQYHLGGYKQPFISAQTITLPLKKTAQVNIYINLSTWFQGIDIGKLNHIMSPSAEAKMLSEKLAHSIYIK
jgi:hypothetical protein